MGNPVTRKDQAHPIDAPPAMHKDRLPGRILQYRQDACYLLVLRRKKTGEPDADVLHTGRFDPLFLPWFVKSSTTQIEHGLDSHARQICEFLLVRLLPVVNVIIETANVRPLGD